MAKSGLVKNSIVVWMMPLNVIPLFYIYFILLCTSYSHKFLFKCVCVCVTGLCLRVLLPNVKVASRGAYAITHSTISSWCVYIVGVDDAKASYVSTRATAKAPLTAEPVVPLHPFACHVAFISYNLQFIIERYSFVQYISVCVVILNLR